MARKRNLISRCVRLATLKNLVAKWQNIESKFANFAFALLKELPHLGRNGTIAGKKMMKF
jgi:hypothetical protein